MKVRFNDRVYFEGKFFDVGAEYEVTKEQAKQLGPFVSVIEEEKKPKKEVDA